jgi:aminoglycoside phosphotransferase (APT) family kinase protein
MLRSLEVPDEQNLARVLEVELADVLTSEARVEPWRRGADFFAFRVVAPGSSPSRVLRVPLREIITSAYDGTVDFGDVVAKEAFVHATLQGHGVPVAPLLGWGRATRPGQHSWMLFELIDHDHQSDLSPGAQASLGHALRDIHRIAADPDLLAAVGSETSPHDMLGRVEARITAFASRPGCGSALDVLDPAMAVINERGGLKDLHLTHMDLRPENLCFRDDELVAVLDLSNCTLGDPVAELGRMKAYGTLTPELLRTYAGGESIDDRLVAAYAVDTYALLGLLGTDEFADQGLVDRGLRGLEECLRQLRAIPNGPTSRFADS